MDQNRVSTSHDGGLSWITRTVPVNYRACDITYANGLFVYAGCSYGGILTSTDAINWTLRTAAAFCSSSSAAFYGVAYGNGLWYASGDTATS